MLPYYRFQCVDSNDYMLYRYVQSGQLKEAREVLTKICRSRSLSSVQVQELLRAAVQTNDPSVLQLILDQGPVLGKESPSENKLSVLWIAVLFNHQNSAELLVRSGADVNELLGAHPVFDSESTVLHVLLQKTPSSWNERFICLVMEHGANLQAQDSKGQSVLHVAVIMGRVRLTEMFLQKGIDVNVANNNGETPFLAAAHTGKADKLLPLLMRHGANIAVSNRIGMNALHLLSCASVEHVDLARSLIEKGVSLEQRESQKQYQPIHFAAANGKKEMIKLYLDHGSSANARAKNGVFPLYLAARSKKPAALETLLKRGASVDLRTDRGRTALHSACYHLQEINIRLLLSVGADMLAEDNDGYTPFSLAEFKSVKNPCVRLMLKELALQRARQPSVEPKDEKIIREDPKLWDYYRKCIEEIDRTKARRFVATCTFFELLTKGHCRIAPLMRNPEFERKFAEQDMNEFPEFGEHLVRAFERAEYCYHFMLEQEELINEAVYESLPSMIVRRIARYLCPKYVFDDCCERVK